MPAGRPRKELDEHAMEQAEKLAAIQCTGEEIASVLGMSYDTLVQRLIEKGYQNFSEWYRLNSAKGRMSLRRYQFEMAKNNSSMAIWLGKQYLNQRDHKELDVDLYSTGEKDVTPGGKLVSGQLKPQEIRAIVAEAYEKDPMLKEEDEGDSTNNGNG